MNISTETTTVWTRGRRLLLAGVTGAVLLGGGPRLAYASQQDLPAGPTSGYATVVDEQGAPVQQWPDRIDDESSTTSTQNSAEDCPGGDDVSEDGGSATPSQPTTPTIPGGDQL
jgi:hypothetical protein